MSTKKSKIGNPEEPESTDSSQPKESSDASNQEQSGGDDWGAEFKKDTTRRSSIFLGERHVPLFNRIGARLIDVLILITLYFVGKALWLPLGVIGTVLFCALQDGFGGGQSIGKRIFGLRVIEDHRGLPCSLWRSALRNFPFLIAIPLTLAPALWLVFLLVVVPLCLLELYLVVSLDSGIRLGDVLANTLVVEHLDDSLVAFR